MQELREFEKTCPDCGKVYTIKRKQSHSNLQLCGSCLSKRHNEQTRRYYFKTKDSAKKYAVQIPCPICGKVVLYHFVTDKERKSKVCNSCRCKAYKIHVKERDLRLITAARR